MDNKQLLIDAAKAAGYLTESWRDSEAYIEGMLSRWNPIESDADAFRLMVDCGIDVLFLSCSVETGDIFCNDSVCIIFSDHDNDKHAATRMAIVRAAAQSQEHDK